jgi:hypothetical protein
VDADPDAVGQDAVLVDVTPLFSAFGPEPIATRLTPGAGRLLVTTSTLYRRKIEPMRRDLASLRRLPQPADRSSRAAGR